MLIVDGKMASAGIAHGKILYFCPRTEDFSEEVTENIDDELMVLQKAIDSLSEKFDTSINAYKEDKRDNEATLCQARKLLMLDLVEASDCKSMIRDNSFSARRAVFEAKAKMLLSFENLEDDFMRERADDIKLVGELLLRELNGDACEFPHLTEPVIIIANEFIPQTTLFFEKDKILGLIIKDTTYNSHSSILARLWNIPALYDIIPDKDWSGHTAIIDGTNERIIIDPDEDEISKVKELSHLE